MQVKFVVMVLISAVIAIFAVQNGENVKIDLFFSDIQTSQALVVVLSVLLGALITLLASTWGRIKKAVRIKSLKKELKAAAKKEKEFTELVQNLEKDIAVLEEEKNTLSEKLADKTGQLTEVREELEESRQKNKDILEQYKASAENELQS